VRFTYIVDCYVLVTYYLIVEIVVNFYVGSYDKANMVTVYGNSECV